MRIFKRHFTLFFIFLTIAWIFSGFVFIYGYSKENQEKEKKYENKNESLTLQENFFDNAYKKNFNPDNKKNENRIRIEEKPDIKILFAGDLMFDRHIRSIAGQKGNDYIFGNLNSEFQKVDFSVVNLEGPVTDNRSISLGSKMGSRENFIFTFDVSVLADLKERKINLVNLGNNHILNFGEKGLIQTRENLKKAKINYFGDTGSENEVKYFVKDVRGYKLGFVNYNAFIPHSKDNAVKDFKKIKGKVDFLILYTHWDREYMLNSSKKTNDLAHLFIDEGVDLIIGSHPHVVQQKEVYKGKMIYYSLGNFIFDQYFSQNTMRGLMVKLIINPNNNEVNYEEIPIVMNSSGQTMLKK